MTAKGHRSFDHWLPGLGAAVIAALITFAVTNHVWVRRFQAMRFTAEQNDELTSLLRAHGLESAGPHLEEHMIRDFLDGVRDGVFLDVGANHYQDFSNTYFLEQEWGWSGIAVEPQLHFAEGFAKYRPRTRFVGMFASDIDDGSVAFYVPPNNTNVGSAIPEFAGQFGKLGAPRHVPTARLTTLLDRAGITRIDFLSMDIELAEPKALAGFDIARFKPRLVCIEAWPEVRQAILDYFSQHDYRLIGKYLRADPRNLYFRPADDARVMTEAVTR